MKKNKIIIYSALIIAGFALLFYLKKPEAAPKSQVREFLRNYEGKKGFAIIKLPDFLMGQVLPDQDSSDIEKDNFSSFRVMIFHQKESDQYNCEQTRQAMVEFLDSLKFQQILRQQRRQQMMRVYQKPGKGAWQEHVTLYSSDSTLFMFNYVNNLKEKQVIQFSSQLNYQDFL